MVENCGLEIDQKIKGLLIKLNNCHQPTNQDLIEIVELISEVNSCQGGGAYNVLVSETIEVEGDKYYPINSFHSFSLNVMEGFIIYEGFEFPAGATRNVEYSTLNQTPLKFTVGPKSKVFLEYLTT